MKKSDHNPNGNVCQELYEGIVKFLVLKSYEIQCKLDDTKNLTTLVYRQPIQNVAAIMIDSYENNSGITAEITFSDSRDIIVRLNEKVLDSRFRNMTIAHLIGHLEDMTNGYWASSYSDEELEVRADVAGIKRSKLPREEIMNYLRDAHEFESDDILFEHYEAILDMLYQEAIE